MSNIVIESVIGPDGTLHLHVPIGIENANQPVRVVIEAARKPMTRTKGDRGPRFLRNLTIRPRPSAPEISTVTRCPLARVTVMLT